MRKRRIPVKKSSITIKKTEFVREEESSNATKPASIIGVARKTASTAVAKSKNGIAKSGINEGREDKTDFERELDERILIKPIRQPHIFVMSI
jgi:hypothetical protein